MDTINRLYALFLKIVNSLQSPFLLFIRIVFGWQFLETGIGHFRNMDKTVAFFTDLHIPAPSFNAHLVSGLETVGGILLILGLASRLISVPLLINMTVAYLTAERDKFTAFFSDSNSFFGADAFPFFLTALLILIFGPGLFALDTLIKRYRIKRSRSQTTAAS
jgi:putative oxidoreductase